MFDFDELNKLVSKKYFEAQTQDGFVDDVLEMLVNIYIMGAEAVEDMLDYKLDMGKSISEMQNIIYRPIENKTFEDRIREYAEIGDLTSIQRVVTTEGHRVYNASAENMAVKIAEGSGRNVGKVWVTMEDEKVRDTHDYLLGMVVPIDEKFYSYDGDSAYYPGGFEKADNNINCRCEVGYVYA